MLPADPNVAQIFPRYFHNHLIDDEDICEGEASSSNSRTQTIDVRYACLAYRDYTDMLRIWSSMDFKSWAGDNIHCPGNAMLLSIQFLMNFHAFRVWLEQVSEFELLDRTWLPNTYTNRVQVDPRLTTLIVKYQDRVITFADRSASPSANINIPQPQSTLLEQSDNSMDEISVK
jgi:hypothetical protein